MARLSVAYLTAGLLLAGFVLAAILCIDKEVFLAAGGTESHGRQLQGEKTRHLDQEDDIGTSVMLTGDEHLETTKWVKSDSGSFHKQRILHRPGWQKTTRCAGSGFESCEECWNSTDCWAPAPTSRVVRSTGGHWSRFVNALHVQCNAPTLTVNYEVLNVQDGRLRLLWDQKEIEQQPGIETHGLSFPIMHGQSGSGSVDIEVGTQIGGHTLEVEFIGSSADSTASLSKLELVVPDSYADCEDFKACLDPLAMNEHARQLRSSNLQQLACLESPSSDECLMWQHCLVSHDRREAIISLLRAGGVGSIALQSHADRRLQENNVTNTTSSTPATTSTTMATTTTNLETSPTTTQMTTEAMTTATTTSTITTSTATTTPTAATTTTTEPAPDTSHSSTAEPAASNDLSLSSDDEHSACLNPLLEDVESWACDCYDEMEARCEQVSSEPFYSRELCMRALVCDHPRICSAWQAEACSPSDPALSLLRSKLQQRRLFERSSSPAVGGPFLAPNRHLAMERTLDSKQCV